jgi:proline iminopeptidase
LYGARRVFPEAWRAFTGFLPEPERNDILASFHRRLIDPDPAVHLPAARAWGSYEGACSTLLPNPETVAAFGEDRLALGLARIEAHFFRNHLFTGERDLIARIGQIRHLPGVIVQGHLRPACASGKQRDSFPRGRFQTSLPISRSCTSVRSHFGKIYALDGSVVLAVPSLLSIRFGGISH